MLTPGTSLGPYTIVAPIGAGGMGEVYRAHDPRLGRQVAIKVLPAEFASDPDRLRRFEQEARAVAALDHPNILSLHDIGSHEGSPYLVTELLEGETLRQRLKNGALLVRKAVEVAVQIAHGLASAHEKGIVHRDIKPENVFLTRDDRVKILDYGLAKLVVTPRSSESAADASTLVEKTKAGVVLGTVGYLSPEQARGQAVDHRADIFALGCVLYEMLSGKRAFAGETAADTLSAVLCEDPAPLRGPSNAVPPGLQGIVSRSLEKRPQDRFSSAHDLALALAAIAESLHTGQPPVESPAKSVVVLPFENLSPDSENAFFADGLTEELIADLSKVRALRVISRTSAMLLKGSKKDVPTIARELNVRYVLEGSVRRAGQSLRITAQLIDAASDAHLWAEKYGGTLDDVFAIQESVSRSIVSALKLTLTADERHRLAARMIPDVKAFDLYLRARQELSRFSEGALDEALRLTRDAIDIAGPNPILFGLVAMIEFSYHDQGIHPDEDTLRRAASWAAKALECDPESAEGLQVRGLIAARKGDMAQAIRDLRQAEELRGSGFHLGFLPWVLSEVGRMDEARRCAEEQVALDPLQWIPRWAYAWVAMLDGDFETALTRMQDAAKLGSDEPIQVFFLGICSTYARRLDKAGNLFARVVDAGASGISTVAATLSALYRRDTDSVGKLLGSQALRDLATQDKEFSWWLASACSFAGETDEALHWLGNAIDLGFVNHYFFSTIDPFLAPLRGDPRFEALIARAREKQAELEARL
jgi:eukaryotic-like serine/threonine-protein kinase